MLIVVEGIDGSGKSTLVSAISNDLEQSRRLHSGPIRQHPLVEYEERLLDYIPGTGDNVICDRWHIGEQIYGPLYRGYSQLTPAMRLHIDLVLEKLGALKILMTTPLPTVMQRLTTRGEKFLQPQHVAIVHDAYFEQCTTLNGWMWAGSRTKIPEIIASAEKRELEAMELSTWSSYIGGRNPKIVIIGDTQDPVVKNRTKLPWVLPPYRDYSGHILFEALSATGLQPHEIGVVNAWDEMDLDALLTTLNCSKIILLGKSAKEVYAETNHTGDVRVMAHPRMLSSSRSPLLPKMIEYIKEMARG